MSDWVSSALKKVEEKMASPAASPPLSVSSGLDVSGELRTSLDVAVRSAAESLRRRADEASAEAFAPVPDAVAVMEEEPLPIVIVEEAPPEEDRAALESALGVAVEAAPRTEKEELEAILREGLQEGRIGGESAAPPAPPPPEPPPPVAAPAPLPLPLPSVPDPVAPLPLPGRLVARLLNFYWTALVRVLTMLDLAMPAPLRAQKPLLGGIGVVAACVATIGLIAVAVARFMGR